MPIMSTVQAIYNGTQGKNIGAGKGHEGASKKTKWIHDVLRILINIVRVVNDSVSAIKYINFFKALQAYLHGKKIRWKISVG